MISTSDPIVRAEIKDLQRLVEKTRQKYGTNRRVEWEGRNKEHKLFGLTREEVDLLWDADIMPWDDSVIVSAPVCMHLWPVVRDSDWHQDYMVCGPGLGCR